MAKSVVGILGCVEVVGPCGPAKLAGGRHRALVAALALRPGQVVPTWSLIEALWGDDPPRTALRSLHSHVARLRQVLSRCGLDGILETRDPGYVLCVEPGDVDATRFEQGVRATLDATGAGMAAALGEALDLWRGTALADADAVGWVAVEAQRLERLRASALADRCEAMLAEGRCVEALGEAERLLAVDPLQERVVGLHMIALWRCGRTAEALDGYQRLRAALGEELGVDPSRELAGLHTAMLRGADVADLRAPGCRIPARTVVAPARLPAPRAARPPVACPAQLPAPVGYFTGRAGELGALDDAVGGGGVALIRGQGGVGKTSLAVQWAHSAIGRFPDGQVFVDVRGHDPATALTPVEITAALLRCLGVSDERMPPELSERIGLYRTLLTGKRLLIVLDNVSGTEQVTPVIPSTAASLLLVTSRNHLAALVTHVEVRQIVLDVLDDGEAVALLAKVLGADRSGREPAATARLGALCGRMPLALRIAAAKLVTQPTRSIGAFVDELDRGDRLAQLGVEDGTRSVEAVFVSAYRTLSRPARRLLRRLGLHPGPHLAGELVAALSGAPLAATEPALAELVAAHLVAQPEPGRYRLHDLIRLFARRLAHTEESAADRTEVLERLVDWYLRCADAANRTLDGSQDRIAAVLRHAPPEVPFPPVRERVLAFLEAERENLAVVVAYAAEHGQPAAACQLTYLLSGFFSARGNWSERIDMCRHAVGAARRLGDPRVEAEMHRALGVAYRATYQLGPALDSHLRALPLLRAIGDEQGLAYLYNNIGGANVELRRFERAVTAYRLSLRLHTRTGNTFGAVIARRNLGYAYIRMGLVERSVEELEQALAASRAIGYRSLEAGTLDSLGEAHLRQERYDEAAACFRDALAVSRDNGDLRYEMDSLANLGLTDLSRGAFDDAAHTLEQALALSRRIGHRHAEARILNLLGEVRLRLGDLTSADRHLTASAELREAVPDDFEEARLHRNLADLADLAARPETARRHRERAAALFRQANAVGEAGAAAPQRAHPDGMITVAVGVRTAPVDAATILT